MLGPSLRQRSSIIKKKRFSVPLVPTIIPAQPPPSRKLHRSFTENDLRHPLVQKSKQCSSPSPHKLKRPHSAKDLSDKSLEGHIKKFKLKKKTFSEIKELLTDFPLFYKELKKLVSHKYYKEAFYWCEMFFPSRVSFEIVDEIRILRLAFLIIRKVLTQAIIGKNPRLNLFTLNNLYDVSDSIFAHWFKFLSTCVNVRIAKSSPQTTILNDELNKYPTLLDQNEEEYSSSEESKPAFAVPQKRRSLAGFMGKFMQRRRSTRKSVISNGQQQQDLLMYTFQSKGNIYKGYLAELQKKAQRFEVPEYTSVAKTLEKSTANLNYRYMIDEYIYNIISMMIAKSELLCRERKFKLCYVYLNKCHEICQIFQFSRNPDIVHACIKCYFVYAKFFFQFNRFNEAQHIYEETINLMIYELSLRMHLMHKSKHSNGKISRCIKKIITFLLSQSLIYSTKEKRNIFKVYEAIKLAAILAKKYLLVQIDEVKKLVVLLSKEISKKLEEYLATIGEIENIAVSKLNLDDRFIRIAEKQPKPSKPQVFEKLGVMDQVREKRFFPVKLRSDSEENLSEKLTLFLHNNTSKALNSAVRPRAKKSATSENRVSFENSQTDTKALNEEENIGYISKSFLCSRRENRQASFSEVESQICEIQRTRPVDKRKDTDAKTFQRKFIRKLGEDYSPKLVTTKSYFRDGFPIDDVGDSESHPSKLEYFHKSEIEKELRFIANNPQKQSRAAFEENAKFDNFDKEIRQNLFDQKEFGFCRGILKQKKAENPFVKPLDMKGLIKLNREYFKNEQNRKTEVPPKTLYFSNPGFPKLTFANLEAQKQVKEHHKKELLYEIIKKINKNEQISAKEEDFVTRIECEQNRSLIIKKKHITEAVSNVIIKHKDTLNLQKLAEQLKKHENLSSQSKSKNSMGSKKRLTIVTRNFNSQMGIFGMVVGKNNGFLDLKSAKNFDKLKLTEGYIRDLREKVSDLNERMKEEIKKDNEEKTSIFRKIQGHVREKPRSAKKLRFL